MLSTATLPKIIVERRECETATMPVISMMLNPRLEIRRTSTPNFSSGRITKIEMKRNTSRTVRLQSLAQKRSIWPVGDRMRPPRRAVLQPPPLTCAASTTTTARSDDTYTARPSGVTTTSRARAIGTLPRTWLVDASMAVSAPPVWLATHTVLPSRLTVTPVGCTGTATVAMTLLAARSTTDTLGPVRLAVYARVPFGDTAMGNGLPPTWFWVGTGGVRLSHTARNP